VKRLIRKQNRGWLVFQIAPETPSGLRWYYRSPQGAIRQEETSDRLPCPETVNTLLILPGRGVTLHRVRPANRRRDALLWQMEPHLLTDPDALHVTTLYRDGDGQLVAVAEPQQLLAWLEPVRALGFEPLRALPETLALQPGTRVRLHDRWVVRLADGTGLSLTAAQWQQIQPHYPALAGDLTVSCEGNPDDSITFRELAEGAIHSRCSVLTHAFAPARPFAAAQARLFATLSVALLALSFLAEPLWSGWQSERERAGLHQQALTRYQIYFPDETPDRPRLQFSRKLSQLDASAQETSLLALLEQSHALLARLEENPLKKLSWDAGSQQITLIFSQPVAASLPATAPQGITADARQNVLTLGRKL
jgi:type II secretion system protein L